MRRRAGFLRPGVFERLYAHLLTTVADEQGVPVICRVGRGPLLRYSPGLNSITPYYSL